MKSNDVKRGTKTGGVNRKYHEGCTETGEKTTGW